MRKIETAIYEPVQEKPGYVRKVGMRKAKDVFAEIKEELCKQGLLPDEYFLSQAEYENEKISLPDFADVFCYARWGTSEGIYLDVEFSVYDESEKRYKLSHFITGKTLREDSAAYDRMQYIAGQIYKMLMGEHQTPARYMLIDGDKTGSRKKLLERIQGEYLEFVRQDLVHRQDNVQSAAAAIGLRSLVVAELPNCLLPEDKVAELTDSENALERLTEICEHIIDADLYEINECISSCRSFLVETNEK